MSLKERIEELKKEHNLDQPIEAIEKEQDVPIAPVVEVDDVGDDSGELESVAPKEEKEEPKDRLQYIQERLDKKREKQAAEQPQYQQPQYAPEQPAPSSAEQVIPDIVLQTEEYQKYLEDKIKQDVQATYQKELDGIKQQQYQQQVTAVYNQWDSEKTTHAQRDADFGDAITFLQNMSIDELATAYPNATPDQIMAELRRNEALMYDGLRQQQYTGDVLVERLKLEARKKGWQPSVSPLEGGEPAQHRNLNEVRQLKEKATNLVDSPSGVKNNSAAKKVHPNPMQLTVRERTAEAKRARGLGDKYYKQFLQNMSQG